MDYAVVLSRASQGLDAPLVRVETHLSNGLPAFTVVGMPETAVRESKDRVRSALLNSHFNFPDRRITVNLAPADLPKSGGRFDLPIALGILSASGQLPAESLNAIECLAELGLDGTLRPISGAVAATLAATRAGSKIVLAPESAARAARVPGSRLITASDILTLCAVLRGRVAGEKVVAERECSTDAGPDLADVSGQLGARRALEIAAAGGHNLIFCGPPGTGKSLLASCLPGILSAPSDEELLTVLALHDLHGDPLQSTFRPFRAPHHSASSAALVGGGSTPQPGEISLAHGGVLFLDELPEFSRQSLDMLREPLETGEITLARARCRLRYPARFQLIAAMNPCPCGYAGDSRQACRCSPARRLAYASRISGPLLDRIDLRVAVSRGEPDDLLQQQLAESSAAVRERVQACDDRQHARQGCRNALLAGRDLLSRCALEPRGERQLRTAMERLALSARAVHRCLRVARTIADLQGNESVDIAQLNEALGYRYTGLAEDMPT
ncbi:MAG: magnesium chelatase family protein [Halieaceae bacterium]|jgi:magnesium chelatase family protein